MKRKRITPLQLAINHAGEALNKTEAEMAEFLGISRATFLQYKRTEGFRLSQFKRLAKELTDEEVLKVIRG